MPRPKTTTPKGAVTNGETPSPTPERAEIERLAYAIWESRDGVRSSPDEDWFEAERRLTTLPPNGRR